MDGVDRIVGFGEEFADQLAQAYIIVNDQDAVPSVVLTLHAASSFTTIQRAVIGRCRSLNNS
jgi:hypothetical protein